MVAPGIFRLAYLVDLVGECDHLISGVDEPEKLVVHGLVLPAGEETGRKRGVDGLVTDLEIPGSGIGQRGRRGVDCRDPEFRTGIRPGGTQRYCLLGGKGGSAGIASR